MGYLATWCDAGGIAYVIEEGNSAEYEIEYLKLRVVSAQFGCTNGQELILHKEDMTNPKYPETLMYEYYPTNLSRIVFNVSSNDWNFIPNHIFPRQLENLSSGQEFLLANGINIFEITPYYEFCHTRRSWWYLDYQGGEPYTFWTNAVHCTRVEPNWTKFYELCRSGASSISNRVKEDSFNDMQDLAWRASDEQLQMMLNDPLFPAVYRGFVESIIIVREAEKNLKNK